MASTSLFTTFKNLKGNARGVVITEPLWGIPYNLFAPYASLYMLTLGVADSQIGLISSVGMVFQVGWSLLSGAITDKLGRRMATLVGDLVSWSVPCLIWAFAQDFYWFLAAAAANSVWRVSTNAWTCLLVEDTEPEALVEVYSWVYIGNLVASFFAPLAGLFIDRFTLVPSVRGLYLVGFVLMTAKFVATYATTHETRVGLRRMAETRSQSLWNMMRENRGVLRIMLHTPATLYTTAIMLLMSIINMISNTFWPILVVEQIHIPAGQLSLYPLIRAVIMLFFYFLVMPRISQLHFKLPMISGYAVMGLSLLVLLITPQGGYALLLLSIFLNACGLAVVQTLIDRMLAVTVQSRERARIFAFVFMAVFLFGSPFGWIAGLMSQAGRSLPFYFSLLLTVGGGVLTWLAAKAPLVEAES